MEGISGTASSDDVDPRKQDYQRFRRIMTGDLNAAIEGACRAGVDEILVNDSHDGARDILLEELNPNASLISGWMKPLGMMQGIDPSFDLAIYVGYHSMAGTPCGVMNHTWTGKVDDVWINGNLAGETAINAGIAGCFDVPVGAVTGDDKLASEATRLLGNIETAVVKEGIDRFAARCLPLRTSRELIKKATMRAVEREKEFKPLKYSSPVNFKVRFASTSKAAAACWLPMLKQEDSRTVSWTFDDYLDSFRTFRSVLSLASIAETELFG